MKVLNFVVNCWLAIVCTHSDYGEDVKSLFYDYVIVGGGPGGLSQLAFLNKVLVNKSFLLIERNPRLGGRIFTSYLEYKNKTIHFENNAMRFHYNNYLSKTLSWLDLCDNDEIVPMKSTPQESKRRYYFGNTQFNGINGESRAAVADSLGIYNFDEYDYNVLLSSGVNNSLTSLIVNHLIRYNNGSLIDNINDYYDCIHNWTIDNTNVSAIDSNNQLIYLDLLNASTEYVYYEGQMLAFNLVLMAQFCSFDIANALDILEEELENDLIVNNESVSSSGALFTLKNGYGQLTAGLYNKIMQTKNDNNNTITIMVDSEVIGVEKLIPKHSYDHDENDEVEYFVKIRNSKNWLQNNYNHNRPRSRGSSEKLSSISRIYSNNVILTIPPSNLKILFPSIEPLRDFKNISDLLFNSLSPIIKSFRVNMIFDDMDFWNYLTGNNSENTNFHRAQSDLGFQDMYVEDWWRNESLFSMQFYAFEPQAAWLNGLMVAGGDNEIIYDSGEIFELDNDSQTDIFYATKPLVNRLKRELKLAVGYDIPQPIAVFSQMMGFNDSNMDGIHLSGAGGNIYQVQDKIRQPLLSENIFIVSSEYSLWTGWSYGAIQAAYYLTVKNLGLPDPLSNVSFCYY